MDSSSRLGSLPLIIVIAQGVELLLEGNASVASASSGDVDGSDGRGVQGDSHHAPTNLNHELASARWQVLILPKSDMPAMLVSTLRKALAGEHVSGASVV